MQIQRSFLPSEDSKSEPLVMASEKSRVKKGKREEL